MIRKIIRPIHLIVGLISGLVLFTVSITGCITSFEEEIRSVVYSDLMEVEESSTQPKSKDEILLIAQKYNAKEEVKNIRIKPLKTSSVEVQFQNRESVYINPYSGKVMGKINRETDFFGTVLEIHKNLYLGETGELITSTSVCLFLIMIISGMILWWPRNKAIIKQKFTIMWKVNKQKRNYDLHSVLGFYASWVIIFTVLTGLIWSFDWAEDTMYWLSNSKKSPRIEVESQLQEGKAPYSIDAIYAKSISKFPEHKECIINLPEGEKGSYRVMFRYHEKGFYRKLDNLFFDQYSGEIVKERLFSDVSTGDKLRMTNENIHTGKVFGLFGQLLVFFASLICASLPITGFMIWRAKSNFKK